MTTRSVKIGGLYKHFKGNIYEVVKIQMVSVDRGEPVPGVVYIDKDRKVWVRTLEDFLFEGLLSDGTIGQRFSELLN